MNFSIVLVSIALPILCIGLVLTALAFATRGDAQRLVIHLWGVALWPAVAAGLSLVSVLIYHMLMVIP